MSIQELSEMRSMSPRKQPPSEPPEESPARKAVSGDACIYCLPPTSDGPPESPARPSHECMIKRLGSWERRQVSVLLHKAGFKEHLFTCGCPASATQAYRACPFYESQADLADDEL